MKHALLILLLVVCPAFGFRQAESSEGQAAYEVGMQALKDHDYKVALSKLKRAVELEPSEPLYFVQLGLTYSILGNYPAAENALTYAAKLNPQSVATWRSLAVVYYVQEKNQEALKALIEAIGLDDTDGTTWARLGSLYLGSHRFEDAERAFGHWSSAEPKRFEPFYWKAQTQLLASRESAAIISLRRALEIDPNFDYAYFLIDTHSNSMEAETALGEYTRRRPQCSDGWQALARAHQSEGKWEDAYSEFRKALDTRRANALDSAVDMEALATVCDKLRRKRESEYWMKAAADLIHLAPEVAKVPIVEEPACSSGIDQIW
jgi:tetratricopeptide (TPR) repeat protein